MEERTIEELRKILTLHYSKVYGGSMEVDRTFVELFPKDEIVRETKKEIRFFALDGTPPKGYALVIDSPGCVKICLYDVNGKRFKEYSNTTLI